MVRQMLTVLRDFIMNNRLNVPRSYTLLVTS